MDDLRVPDDHLLARVRSLERRHKGGNSAAHAQDVDGEMAVT